LSFEKCHLLTCLLWMIDDKVADDIERERGQCSFHRLDIVKVTDDLRGVYRQRLMPTVHHIQIDVWIFAQTFTDRRGDRSGTTDQKYFEWSRISMHKGFLLFSLSQSA